MGACNENSKAIVAHLSEIREACAVATSKDDLSMNAVIEEIDRLARIVLQKLNRQ